MTVGIPQDDDGRIVVGVDGSEGSKDALRWAIRQAEMSGAALEVVMTWHVPLSVSETPTGYDFGSDAERTLDEAIRDTLAEHPTIKVSTRAIQGPSAFILLDMAAGADVLVVGSRGHGATVGTLVGSTAQHCVTHARGPVMVVHQTPSPDREGSDLPAHDETSTEAAYATDNIEEMTAAESLELLRSEHIGRIGVTVRRRPEIFPVNYSLDASDSIVLRTARGMKLAGGVNHHVVFEVDRFEYYL